MMDKVLGYVRVSTQGRVKDGYSLAYQVEEIERYCAHHELELVHIYQDAGVSGAKVDEAEFTIDREGSQEILSDLAWQEVKYIVVLNTSRLWRSDIVKVLIQRELKRHKVDIKAIEQTTYSIYAHDPTDVLVNGMLELLDQYQRLEIALKLSRGRRKKAQQGGYAGGRVAFGYAARKGQKDLQVDDEQAKVIRLLFELRKLYPQWSLSQYAEELNRAGNSTAQGKSFTKVQVKRILDREALYRGHYRYGQIEAQGQHQAII
jgi:DNA invertase Pin-like site-specific DNA recombinase